MEDTKAIPTEPARRFRSQLLTAVALAGITLAESQTASKELERELAEATDENKPALQLKIAELSEQIESTRTAIREANAYLWGNA